MARNELEGIGLLEGKAWGHHNTQLIQPYLILGNTLHPSLQS